jgi:N4-gp56 family major capsid protein
MPEYTFELASRPEERKDAFGVNIPWKTFNMAATVTQVSSIRGSATTTAYANLIISWLRKAMDAAKENQRFPNAFSEHAVPEGSTSIFIPKRTKYVAASSWETTAEEIAVNTDVTWTALTNINGVNLAPTDAHAGVEFTDKAVRTSAVNLIQFAREELSYRVEDALDTSCSTALDDATAQSNTVVGMQTIFGGDATDANNSLDNGDILTTDLITKAKRLLKATQPYYWNSNAWTAATGAGKPKNAWQPEPAAPFLLYIAPEQAEGLQNDSQFTNAAEYGGREVVLGGEIGQYLGIKVIETTKVPGLVSGDNFTHQGTTVSVDTNVHTCYLVKGQKCGGIAWAVRPSIKVFDWPSGAKKRAVLDYSYAAGTIFDDAIVKIAVTDV